MSICLDPNLQAPETGFQEYTIQKNEHTFTDRFVVLSKDGVVPVSTVKTNNYAYSLLQFFDWRSHYDLVSQDGQPIAYGIKQYGFSLEGIYNLSFLGLIKPGSLSDIKVWDQDGNTVGLIDGRVMTLSQARFDIQDEDRNVIGEATYDKEAAAITIYDPNNSDNIIGYMKRNFVQDTKDTWTVAYSNQLDPRTMLVFASYILQNQSRFKQDV